MKENNAQLDEMGGRANGSGGMPRGGGGGGRGGGGEGGGREGGVGGLPASSSVSKLEGGDDPPRTMRASSNLRFSSSPGTSHDSPNPQRRKNREPVSSVKGNWTQEEDDRLQK